MNQTIVVSVQVDTGSDAPPNFFSVVRGLHEAAHVFAFFGGDSNVSKAEGDGLYVFVVDGLDADAFAKSISIIKNIFRDLGIRARILEAKKVPVHVSVRPYDDAFFGTVAGAAESVVYS